MHRRDFLGQVSSGVQADENVVSKTSKQKGEQKTSGSKQR